MKKEREHKVTWKNIKTNTNDRQMDIRHKKAERIVCERVFIGGADRAFFFPIEIVEAQQLY